MSKNEQEIEAEIQAKGLNAPRLNPAHIDATITGEAYHVFPETTLTICALSLRNGFIVTGESAAASPENFDEAIGRKIARENARNKIWALEGYLLREKLSATPTDYRDRVRAEREALAGNLERLNAFIANDPRADDLMRDQADCMTGYLEALDRRIAAF